MEKIKITYSLFLTAKQWCKVNIPADGYWSYRKNILSGANIPTVIFDIEDPIKSIEFKRLFGEMHRISVCYTGSPDPIIWCCENIGDEGGYPQWSYGVFSEDYGLIALFEIRDCMKAIEFKLRFG